MREVRRTGLTDYERRYCSPSAQRGLRLVRGCGDALVLAAARDAGSLAHRALMRVMGPSTNPTWLTGRCAEVAYERGLMDEREFDWLAS